MKIDQIETKVSDNDGNIFPAFIRYEYEIIEYIDTTIKRERAEIKVLQLICEKHYTELNAPADDIYEAIRNTYTFDRMEITVDFDAIKKKPLVSVFTEQELMDQSYFYEQGKLAGRKEIQDRVIELLRVNPLADALQILKLL